VHAGNRDISTQVGGLVQHLQFQDLTRQEIDHVVEALRWFQAPTGPGSTENDSELASLVVGSHTSKAERDIHERLAGSPANSFQPAIQPASPKGADVGSASAADDLGDNVTLF